MNQPSPEQMQALLQYASQKLGMPPDQLAALVKNGGYEGLTSSLSDNSRRTLERLAGDPQKLQALLSSPQVRELLKRL
ncbi:MAG: hypothetical protein E7553_02080 [Ruminococcaceae bacterium]|nr:hypothetical protein [Oscillospiraceae bacterium]